MKVVTQLINGPDQIYAHLSLAETGPITLFVTNSPATPCDLGSFVYALPSSEKVVSSRLFQEEATIDYAERLASLIVKKLGRPAFVGSSIRGFESAIAVHSILMFVQSVINSMKVQD